MLLTYEKEGFPPAAADCVIATVALKHRVPLIHCDRDFEAMKTALPLKTHDWTTQLEYSR